MSYFFWKPGSSGKSPGGKEQLLGESNGFFVNVEPAQELSWGQADQPNTQFRRQRWGGRQTHLAVAQVMSSGRSCLCERVSTVVQSFDRPKHRCELTITVVMRSSENTFEESISANVPEYRQAKIQDRMIASKSSL